KILGPSSFEEAVKQACNAEIAFNDTAAASSNVFTPAEVNILFVNHFESSKKNEELNKKIDNLTQISVGNHSASEPWDRSAFIRNDHGSSALNVKIECNICGKGHITTECWYFPRESNAGSHNSHPQRSYNRGNFYPRRGFRNTRSRPFYQDILNQKIFIKKQSFGLYEDKPRNSSPSVSADTESSQVRLVNNVTILPNSSRILKLKISDSFTNEKNVIYIPSCIADISINESIHHVDNSGNIITIVENITSNKITLRKNSKLGQVHSTTDFVLRDSNDFDEEPNEILQVNTLTVDEITTLRREELNADDFNLEHLNETEKIEILKLLMQHFNVFSKSYQTLGCTDAITPEFKLLHNFPIQTKPYPIPKIAHDFAKQEIQKLLEAGIIEPSSSNYSVPISFVKKKSDSKGLKIRMVVDYRLLNSVTESFKICLPKIADILHEISGKKWYSVLDLKSTFFLNQVKEFRRTEIGILFRVGKLPTHSFAIWE
ncbi:hypothetical protein AVEN_236964-1, partial [Araneus ventricosus]